MLTANTLCLAWPFDLELTKEVDKQEAFEGEIVVFTIVVNNHGLGDPSSVIVEDVLPAGLSLLSRLQCQSGHIRFSNRSVGRRAVALPGSSGQVGAFGAC